MFATDKVLTPPYHYFRCMLSLFASDALPVPLDTYFPAAAILDFATRVEKLRRWQQSINTGYVNSEKEEALQAEFLTLVFGQALGYEHERPEHRQLLIERKTNVDGTKPDGSLGEFAADPKGALGGPVRAVIELKGARTYLDAKQKLGAKGRNETPVEQAFSYPSKMGASCRWVIVSNFLELRLYAANDQTRAEVFDFRTLPDQPAALQRFFALLSAGQLLPAPGQADAPLDHALRQRQEQEARISKDFYRDYRKARRDLLEHLIEQNPDVAPLDLLQHTQKLLDRVIFVCFCEDKSIIPRLTFRRLLDAVRANVFDPAEDKIYRTVRGLFQSIDKGNPLANINRFNGGLFAPDAALDALVIKDRTLKPVIDLEQYNFASELNVNILGHIFEQSLADLEAERARLQGQTPPTAKEGKRKQEGIFYTPDYITRYIVEQAVGGWLRERRQEAGIDALPELTDADLASIRVNLITKRLITPTARVQQHIAAWESYGLRLRAIRVLDPACGSGAFLNEAFGYLLREGQVVNTTLAELRAGQFEVFELDRHILQHNLYGVDLNPESVQITRLSLWLQTANPHRPLTSLDHSIRCGNSLIADPAVAGDRAFNWQEAFPEAFADGGFDIVVGNPPYVVATKSKFGQLQITYLLKHYNYAQYNPNTYALFTELAFHKLLKDDGNIGYIIPSGWLSAQYFSQMRADVYRHEIGEIINLKNSAFDEVVETLILIAKNQPAQSKKVLFKHDLPVSGGVSPGIAAIDYAELLANSLNPFITQSNPLIAKLDNLPSIGQYATVYRGIETRSNKEWLAKEAKDFTYVPILLGSYVNKYTTTFTGTYLRFIKSEMKSNANEAMYLQPKILMRRTGASIIADLDIDNLFALKNLYLIIPQVSVSIYSLLAQLNSKLMHYYHVCKSSGENKAFAQFKGSYVTSLPCVIDSQLDQNFQDKVEKRRADHRALQKADTDFATLLRAELGLTGKLALTLAWKPWSTALEKSIGRALSLKEKGEWLHHYEAHQQAQTAARQRLAQLDLDLDLLVYKLYQLTPTEIALVEGMTTTEPLLVLAEEELPVAMA